MHEIERDNESERGGECVKMDVWVRKNVKVGEKRQGAYIYNPTS